MWVYATDAALTWFKLRLTTGVGSPNMNDALRLGQITRLHHYLFSDTDQTVLRVSAPNSLRPIVQRPVHPSLAALLQAPPCSGVLEVSCVKRQGPA